MSEYAAPAATSEAGQTPAYASWGRRLVAALLDGLISLIPTAALIGVAYAILVGVGEPTETAEASGPVLAVFWLLFLVALLLGPLYFTYFEGSARGQPPGKRIMGIRVCDDVSGGPIGYGRAFGRYALVFAFGFFCAILSIVDGLWPLWDAKKQTVHDKAVGSIVVRT